MQTIAGKCEAQAAKSVSKSAPFFGKGAGMPFFQPQIAENTGSDVLRQQTDGAMESFSPALQLSPAQNSAIQRVGTTEGGQKALVQREAKAPEEEKEQVQREAKAPKEEKEQVQREAKAPEEEKEQVQREAKAPEEEKEQVQREAKAPEEEKEQVQREAKAPEEEKEQVQREAKSPEEEKEQVQREAKAPEEEKEQVQREAKTPEEEKEQVQREAKAPESGIPDGQAEILSAPAPAPSTNTAVATSVAPVPMHQPTGIQPSLKVGAPDDHLEREADEMAEKVQRMPQKQWAIPDGRTDPANLQRQEDEDGTPDLQGKIVQRAPELQRSANGALSTSSQFASRLQTAGSGSPLPTPTQQHMEGAFGADFGTVRIHTGTEAAQLSDDIGARAFTHKNNIFFNSGEYNPGSQEGQFLLAHELTHTVQQGAAVHRQPADLQTTEPQIQATFLDSIGTFFSDTRDRVIRFVQRLPGYFLLSVIIGSDPITGATVERTGLNFIRGFMLLLPGGEAKYNQLRDSGGLQNAANWMDQQIAEVGNLRNRFSDAYDRARNSISADDLLDIDGAFERITGYFAPVVRDALAYAERLIVQILTFIKDALLGALVNFVKDHTRAYPLMRTLMGHDPITGEEVPATMENILQGFLSLTEAGEAYYNKLVETGVLARATTWMRAQIATLPTLDQVVNAFSTAWNSFSFADLVQPAAAFERIYNILADPIGRIVNFVVNVATEILRLIKEALLSLLRQHANEIRGYRLMTVLFGKDPVTDQAVERNARNILSGFVELVAGPEKFAEIEQSGAIERMAAWLDGLLQRTGISLQMVIDLFLGIWNSVTIQDLVHPIDTFQRIIAKFRDPIERVLTFIVEVIKKVIEVVLQLMNLPVALVQEIIQRAMAAFDIIKRDPIAFLVNLLRAVKLGFEQFFGNIGTHLLGGLTGWLFGELESAGIRPPTELNFRAILGFVLDVLGISVERIWQKLAEHPRIGPERVARIRGMIDRLTGIWTIIQEVITEGPGALWRHLEEQLSNLWNMVLDQVKNWVMEQIVTQMVTRLLSMLDPTGIMAVIRSVEAFYRAVQSFIERLNEILRIINSFVGGILEIAQGNLATAANFLERTMANAMPTVIGFLANQIGLRGLGRRIAEMIERVRELVDQGLTWLVNRVVNAGMNLLDRAMAAGRSVRDAVMGWLGLRKEFRATDGSEHHLYVEGNANNAELYVATDPKPVDDFLADVSQVIHRPSNSAHVVNYNGAVTVNNQMNTIKQRLKNPSNPNQQQDYEQFNQKMGILATKLPSLMTLTGETEPPPLLKPAFSDNVKATSFMVRYLKSGRISGGAPSDSHRGNLLGWAEVQQSGLSGSSRWVRMHLLTELLGGPAVDANLTPADGPATNISFARNRIEHPAVADVNSGKVIWYKVTISYHSGANQNYISSIEMEYGPHVHNTTTNVWEEKPSGFRINNTPIGKKASKSTEPPDLAGGSQLININSDAGRVRIEAMSPLFDRQFAEFVIRVRDGLPNGFRTTVHLRNQLEISYENSRIEIENFRRKVTRLVDAYNNQYWFGPKN